MEFVINKGYSSTDTVTAEQFTVDEYWARFYDESGALVFARPLSQIHSIEKVGVAK